MSVIVKFEGGPADGKVMAIPELISEYKYFEPCANNTNTVELVEHVYKLSDNDLVYWYYGSKKTDD